MNLDEQIGKYKVQTKLGAGGMGEVFLARDEQLDRQVVLKFLSAEFSDNADLLQRFKQEARAASALNHPNIITIYEIGESNNRWFIATEYIKGQTLREVLKNSPLSINKVIEIVQQICQALIAAHSAGIIHRDIKPENIMLRDDGLVKVLDFGLAKLTEKSQQEIDSEAQTRAHVKTSAGMILGTIAYMSPEQARGVAIDKRTDIWSLGIVLYEMLTGSSPFEGETTSDIIASILKTETPSVQSFKHQVSPQLEQIVFKALQKDLNQRYQNLKEFSDDLSRIEKLEVTETEPRTSILTKARISIPTGDEKTTKILSVRTDSKKTSNQKLIFGAAALLLVIFGVSYWFYQARPSGNNPAQIESLAVIPFINVGNNTETEYLSDGITESLINSLSKLPHLTVKARSSVFRYKGKEVEPQKLANELSVQAILTGRVTQRDDNLSLSLELVDTKTGNLLWGESYNRKITDAINLQSEIVKEVSNKLRNELSASEKERVGKNYTNNSEAYQLYLKGRYFLNKRTPDDFEKAVRHFRQAIDIEPNYALAYAGLAACYTEMTYWSIGLPREMMPKAKAAAQKSLELDETLSEGHTSLATVAEDFDWNFKQAETEYLRAIELNPNNANAFDQYGGFLCEQKRFAEGMTKLNKAAELDPLSAGVEMSKGACLYQEKRYDEAINQIQKILKTEPSYLPASSLLGAVYLRKGMFDQTVEEWLKNSPLENYTAEDIAAWKKSYQTGGIKGFLQKDIEFRKIAVAQGRNQTLFIAMQYANLGDNEEALVWLERAFEERHSWLGELDVEPAWDNLRNDARFQNLLQRVGFGKQN
jgi:serine/threonine protein kinase/Tfp pilus assembly protein PilF